MGRATLFLLASFFVLAGCGGGGLAGSSGGTSSSAGFMGVSGSTQTPVVMSSASTTAYGLVGTITTASIQHMVPTADESEIVISFFGSGGYSIGAINADGTGLRTIVSGLTAHATSLRVNSDCTFVYYLRSGNLHRVPLSGGVPSTLIAGVQSFAITPSGSKVFYRKSANAELWLANANGSAPVLIHNSVSDPATVIACPTEGIGWVRRDSSANFTIQLVPGATITGSATAYGTPTWQTFDPVSNRSTVQVFDSGYYRMLTFFFNGDRIRGLQENGINPIFAHEGALEPGGNRVAALRRYSGAAGHDALEIIGLDGGVQQSVFTWSTVLACAYTPFRPTRPIVGPGTSWPTGVGALMFSQVGQGVRGVAIADGTSNTLLVAETPGGIGNPIYNVSNDGVLTKLYTAAGHCHTWTPIVNGNTGLKGALVSFDSITGRVGSIVTYTKKPTLERVPGGFRVVGGEVVDVFDAKGTRKPVSAEIRL